MSRTHAFAAAATFALLALPPENALAYSCLAESCPKWCAPVPYALAAPSADLGPDVSATELQRAFTDWSRVSCANLTTSYTGMDPGAAQPGDGRSRVAWIETGFTRGRGVLGYAGPRWGSDGCAIEGDMILNGEHYTWTTEPGRGSTVNAYSILLHESGHYLGLGHSEDLDAVMFSSYGGGIDTILQDDQDGICALYPGGTADCAVAGCPAGQMCGDDGDCIPRRGDGSYCSVCSADADCGGPDDLCVTYPDMSYCAVFCENSDDCPDESLCTGVDRDTGRVGQCRRFVEGVEDCASLPPSGAPIGTECVDGSECSSGLCLVTADGQVCSMLCDSTNPGSCPTATYCEGTSVCGEGRCVTGSPGTVELGGPCARDTDCESLLCDRGTCAEPCRMDGSVACAADFVCQPTGIASCGACKPDGSVGGIGDSCTSDVDCATEICVASRDGAYCTNFCDDVATFCPEEFACRAVGDDVSVCAPLGGRDDGCGCSLPGASRSRHLPALLALALGLCGILRRRR